MGLLVKLVLTALNIRLTPIGVTVPPVIPEQPVIPSTPTDRAFSSAFSDAFE